MVRKIPALVLSFALTAGAAAAAQARRVPPPNDPAMAEIAAYRLSTATLEKVAAAMQALRTALAADPKYKAFTAAQNELAALRQKDDPTPADIRRMDTLERQMEEMSAENDPGDAQTLADMVQKIAAMPHMAEALSAAGLTPREYAKFNLTLLQAGFFAGMKKAGQLRQLPPGVSMENVQFVIDHEREIAALDPQMQGR